MAKETMVRAINRLSIVQQKQNPNYFSESSPVRRIENIIPSILFV